MPMILNNSDAHLRVAAFVIPPSATADIPADEWEPWLFLNERIAAEYLQVAHRDPVSR